MHDRHIFSRNVPSRRPCLTAVLRMAGLRPTRQRVALAEILFGGEHRHVSAEQLLDEASAAKVNVSLATIYNTLHQFRAAGLLREVAVDAARSYFDTDTSDHHHFYLEDEQRVIDIPASAIVIQNLPEPPPGHDDHACRCGGAGAQGRLSARRLSRSFRPDRRPRGPAPADSLSSWTGCRWPDGRWRSRRTSPSRSC